MHAIALRLIEVAPLAQAGAPAHHSTFVDGSGSPFPASNLVLLALLGGALLLALIATIGGFLHYRRERLLTHAERLKALELGRPMPDDSLVGRIQAAVTASSPADPEADPDRALARKCLTAPAWIAFAGFLFGGPAAASLGTGAFVALAAAIGAIGVTAMICGTILATHAASRPPVAARYPTNGKPTFESEAFEHIS